MRELSEQKQLLLFEQLGLFYLVEAYINSGQAFCDKAQLVFLSLPVPLTEEQVLHYLEKGHKLCEAAEMKLFELSEWKSLLEYYCFTQKHSLFPKAQMKLLVLSEENRDFVKRYIRLKQQDLCADFVKKAKEQGLMK